MCQRLWALTHICTFDFYTFKNYTFKSGISDLQGNHFLDHPDTFDQIFDFYSFDFYTFKNKITILKVYE